MLDNPETGKYGYQPGMFNMKYLLLTLFAFAFIYTPLVLLPFNIIHLLTAIALLMLLAKYPEELSLMLSSRELLIFSLLHLIITLYCFVMVLTGSAGLAPAYYAASTIVEVVPCAMLISIILLKGNRTINDLYDFIMLIGFLQVICVLITIASPELRNWIIASSGSQGLEDVFDTVSLFRIYGLARSYTFSMPLFQGLCVMIAIVSACYRSPKYLLLLPFYLVSIVLNARTPMISFVVPLLPLLVYNYDRMKQNLGRNFLVAILAAACLFAGYHIIKFNAESSTELTTWTWLYMGARELTNITEGEATGNLSALTETMWFAPKGLELIIGTGENVFGREFKSSDIGYVANLYFGGIFFSLLMYSAYLYLISCGLKGSRMEKTVNLSILLYLFLANLKGNVFRPNEIIHGVILILVFTIAHNRLSSSPRKSRDKLIADTDRSLPGGENGPIHQAHN